jgi:hypothetical protein
MSKNVLVRRYPEFIEDTENATLMEQVPENPGEQTYRSFERPSATGPARSLSGPQGRNRRIRPEKRMNVSFHHHYATGITWYQ